MPSYRENIMASLLTSIQAINGPPTYTHTVGADQIVSRDPIDILELHHAHQLPAAILEEGEQVIDARFEDASAFVPAALSMSSLNVTVIALLTKRGGVNTDLNAWMADILKAVTVDTTRGGSAIDTDLVSIGPPREDRAIPDDLAAAEMRLVVKYVHQANTL